MYGDFLFTCTASLKLYTYHVTNAPSAKRCDLMPRNMGTLSNILI